MKESAGMLTLLIRCGTGCEDITLPHLQKFFDRLAASPFTFTYLAVDPDLQLIDHVRSNGRR